MVYATARKLSNLKECETAGAKILELDVTDPATIKTAVDKIISESGKIGERPPLSFCVEILRDFWILTTFNFSSSCLFILWCLDYVINNAGYALFGPLLDLTDEQLKGNFDTNVFGQVPT